MLQHMIEAEIFDLILHGVDLLVGTRKVRLNHEGGRVAIAAGGGVVGARVAALRLDVGNVAVLNG